MPSGPGVPRVEGKSIGKVLASRPAIVRAFHQPLELSGLALCSGGRLALLLRSQWQWSLPEQIRAPICPRPGGVYNQAWTQQHRFRVCHCVLVSNRRRYLPFLLLMSFSPSFVQLPNSSSASVLAGWGLIHFRSLIYYVRLLKNRRQA